MDRIDELLCDWWEWSQGFNPGTGYQGFDSTTAQYRSSRQWMDFDDLDAEVEQSLKKAHGKAIEPMILKLDLRARIAVNTQMRNFASGAASWSSVRVENLEGEYARAKDILCPQMVAAGLLDKSACKPAENVLTCAQLG
ncbi:hypothetical protein [Paraburkholderia unamae]|uniref:Uncharacterized protein n=1 Tax=Paraburkholderia unamae TaxID=219649 RepID=A0ABX5KHE4_9BURK|nr:hypothetical protein [Paraburkholderia unamae]PVX77182.1 hypothetical protein C7402_115241 [Paraburkholderia unamae]